MSDSNNEKVVRDHYQASAKGDIAKMFENVSSQIVWREMDGFPCAGVYRSQAAIIENVFQVLGRDWIDYRFELEQIIDAGDFVFGVGNYHSTHKTTLKKLDARVVHLWKLQGGKIVRFEQFTDTLLVQRASLK